MKESAIKAASRQSTPQSELSASLFSNNTDLVERRMRNRGGRGRGFLQMLVPGRWEGEKGTVSLSSQVLLVPPSFGKFQCPHLFIFLGVKNQKSKD